MGRDTGRWADKGGRNRGRGEERPILLAASALTVDHLLFFFRGEIGWAFNDPLTPMNDAYGIYRKPTGSYFTNRELVMLFDPSLPELPYIFDDFGYSQCA